MWYLQILGVDNQPPVQDGHLAAPTFACSCPWSNTACTAALEAPVAKEVLAFFISAAGTVDLARQDLFTLMDLSDRVYCELSQ